MDHYDIIVIGNGPGGAWLAPIGERIVLIKRGDRRSRSQMNRGLKAVVVGGAHQAAARLAA